MSKYIDADKVIAEIERREKIIRNSANQISDSEKKKYYSGCADALLELLPFIASLQQEAEKERIKEQKELNKIAIQYRDDVIAHIEEKRALPSFKGQLLHDFKNEVNTMKQILGVLAWGDIQYALFEKFALVFAAWGGYHFHPKDVESEDSLKQEQPIKVYRVENEKEQKGLWRKFDGTWEPLFDMLTDGQCKDMPMEDSPIYREGGKQWFASAPSKETLQKWFSKRDLEELTAKGFTISEFEVVGHKKVSDFEYIFTRDNIISRTYLKVSDIYPQEQPDNIIQWTGNNLKEVIAFTGKSPRFGEWFKSWEEYENYVHTHNDILKLFCNDGSYYEVPVGAWIVKTPDGYNVPSVAKHVQQEQSEVDLIIHHFHELGLNVRKEE